MKTVILGDIHGRAIWKDIVTKESPDRVIFLGDYFTSRELIPEEKQFDNLVSILEYKETSGIEMILLRGNHDLEALHYHWAQCYPYFAKKHLVTKEFKERFLTETQWVFVDEENVIYSHAGVSKTWFEQFGFDSVESLNSLKPSEKFAFSPGADNPRDCQGYSRFHSCVWIRPSSLREDMLDDRIQVVGHTRLPKECSTYLDKIWLCDCLPKSYLVKENGEFESKVVVKS